MSHTIFVCRDSDGVVHCSELLFLWAMLNNIHLNIDSHLVRQLAKVGKTLIGDIVIGRLITSIALTLGYDLTDLQENMGSSRIDIELVLRLK